jgi:hypothetical protein
VGSSRVGLAAATPPPPPPRDSVKPLYS